MQRLHFIPSTSPGSGHLLSYQTNNLQLEIVTTDYNWLEIMTGLPKSSYPTNLTNSYLTNSISYLTNTAEL